MSSDRLDWSQPASRGDGTWLRRGGRRPVCEDAREIFEQSNAMTTGINFNEYDKIPTEVSGKGAAGIGHIDSFGEAKLDAGILRNIEKCGYTKPTPVQKHAIPVVMAKRDLMACAQTGSGKTGAFLLPTIHRMIEEGPPASVNSSVKNGGRWKAYPVSLVLAPTRELASQIFEEARKYCYGTGIRSVVVYGGAEIDCSSGNWKEAAIYSLQRRGD
ncbi:DEAD box ATP-dependent RNA helicase, putative [Perkinsus marinus ATCC 50983]|uniref:DEAD box ATP-dependent RNA helicase, putative n=1 Tax=Perkinsus marinus (strain ATCC 50983 / TXsc) TaxID=423536 RepID=C5KW95_PERM5|nr:DEAD box ATP-dependent RNA helicase, putative [Perkinsus marinus ATCC 50983]EER11206.1 DEAD box ATP-dependent RNA helicase, putative [Perkinsus marinus ATCC 50983]|eukprot:XP_002779411.1 DEAD box ATP-dependent RNA helicase, putative [Perkinsus marinus ATCC 50983]